MPVRLDRLPVPNPPLSRGGISLAVYRVDASGTHVVKPRRVVGAETDAQSWPFTRAIPDDREPPCQCSATCRYLHPRK